MKDHWCTNYTTCKLVNLAGFCKNDSTRQKYLKSFCEQTHKTWSKCKRYEMKNELGSCPDFVFPDTTMTLAEIITKFDEQND